MGEEAEVGSIHAATDVSAALGALALLLTASLHVAIRTVPLMADRFAVDGLAETMPVIAVVVTAVEDRGDGVQTSNDVALPLGVLPGIRRAVAAGVGQRGEGVTAGMALRLTVPESVSFSDTAVPTVTTSTGLPRLSRLVQATTLDVREAADDQGVTLVTATGPLGGEGARRVRGTGGIPLSPVSVVVGVVTVELLVDVPGKAVP